MWERYWKAYASEELLHSSMSSLIAETDKIKVMYIAFVVCKWTSKINEASSNNLITPNSQLCFLYIQKDEPPHIIWTIKCNLLSHDTSHIDSKESRVPFLLLWRCVNRKKLQRDENYELAKSQKRFTKIHTIPFIVDKHLFSCMKLRILQKFYSQIQIHKAQKEDKLWAYTVEIKRGPKGYKNKGQDGINDRNCHSHSSYLMIWNTVSAVIMGK